LVQEYMTQITPPQGVSSIWYTVFGILTVWYIFVFYLLLCRQIFSRRNKSPLFPGIFWLLLIIIHVLNATWLYLFFHNHMVISGIILIILTLILYLLNVIAYRICWLDVTCNTNCNNDDLEYGNCNNSNNNSDIVELSSCEIAFLRILTLNGLPLYAMWCSLLTCIQWAMILQYFTFHLSDNVSTVITLAILSVVLILYWHMDLLVKREYFVHTWAPSVVLIVTFSVIISRNHSIGGEHKPGLLFVFILLIISAFMTLIKLISLCLCPPKHYYPRFSRV